MTAEQQLNVIDHPVKQYKKRERLHADRTAVERMRTRLELSPHDFSEALGYGRGAYSIMLRRDDIPKVVQVAAEALVRRQARGTDDQLMLLRIVKGIVSVQPLSDLQIMQLNGKRYLLVEQP